MTLSWTKTVRELSAELQRMGQRMGLDARDAEVEAKRILRRALSDKQRARLDARDD